MGVDTKIHIVKDDDTFQMVRRIENVIKNKLNVFGEITVSHDHKAVSKDQFQDYDGYRIHFALDYPCDQFESKKEQRMVWVYFDNYQGGNLLYLSFGNWGHNVELAKCLVDNFGGIADFNDCDDVYIDYAMPQPKIKEDIKF